MKRIFQWILAYKESFIWINMLLVLYFSNIGNTHFSLCIFKFLGFQNCLGCGIGNAIHCILHFKFTLSFQYHIMGIPAIVAILYLILKPLMGKLRIHNEKLSIK